MKAKTKKILTLTIFIIAILIVSIYLYAQNKDISKTYMSKDYKTPTLNIDPNYFAGGEVLAGGSTGDDQWSYAIIREGYRSQPTTDISLESDYYKQEISDLPSIKTNKDIYIMEEGIGHDTFDEQIKTYGDLARRYLPHDLITSVENFDVDKDGVDERIVSTCGLWGNGCPHDIYIVKNNKIIFSTTAMALLKTNNGNGFTVVWQKEYKDWTGEMRTRFIFEDGKFRPLYEQEVKYFEAKISE